MDRCMDGYQRLMVKSLFWNHIIENHRHRSSHLFTYDLKPHIPLNSISLHLCHYVTLNKLNFIHASIRSLKAF